MHDNTLAVPILAALLIVLLEGDRRAGTRLSAVSIAGVLAGAAAGMKLAVGPLCLGLCASVAVLPGRLSTRTARVLVFSLSVGLGVILTGGFWMWIMHQNFGSPLFPFVNAFFRSRFAPVENFADLRMMPKDWTQVVFYPFMWMSTQSLVTEPPSRDSRFATVFMFVTIWAMASALRKVAGERADHQVEAGRLLLVVTFWLVSYVVWLEMFSTYRYVISLEVLAAAVIFGVAAQVTPAWTSRFAIAVPVCVALALSARPPGWGRTAWSDSYFGVDESLLVKYRGFHDCDVGPPARILAAAVSAIGDFRENREQLGPVTGDRHVGARGRRNRPSAIRSALPDGHCDWYSAGPAKPFAPATRPHAHIRNLRDVRLA